MLNLLEWSSNYFLLCNIFSSFGSTFLEIFLTYIQNFLLTCYLYCCIFLSPMIFVVVVLWMFLFNSIQFLFCGFILFSSLCEDITVFLWFWFALAFDAIVYLFLHSSISSKWLFPTCKCWHLSSMLEAFLRCLLIFGCLILLSCGHYKLTGDSNHFTGGCLLSPAVGWSGCSARETPMLPFFGSPNNQGTSLPVSWLEGEAHPYSWWWK